jgi:uncharacterized membrane protein YphA (DoxX/SURF4 family)
VADEPVLNMLKVPSDPSQVIVNHASFRVRLGATSARALDRTARMPVIPGGRRAPVVWAGGEAAGSQLREALHGAEGGGRPQQFGAHSEGATQVLPRVAAPRRPSGPYGGPGGVPGGRRPPHAPAGPSAHPGGPGAALDDTAELYGIDGHAAQEAREARARRAAGAADASVRHAWYPGRRMNLGIVLLPLRVFLGFISIYAGLGKLCDRVYFDGGRRGSMVHWLSSLHPWGAAEPLLRVALAHPVGAGLTVAFLQIVAGVLTVVGLWQRAAAAIGGLLSGALLVTVAWRTGPVYDAPNIIYLAAWSPLVIAGAPVYSVDGRLAGQAWRRLGPRTPLWDLRRYVLRRGAVLASVLAGLSLVVGATLGAAVRSTEPVPARRAPSRPPVNSRLGSPLPEAPGAISTRAPRPAHTSGAPRPSASASGASPSPHPSASATAGATGTPGAGSRLPSHATRPGAPAPATGGSTGSGSAGGTSGGAGSSGSPGGSHSSGSGSGSSGGSGGGHGHGSDSGGTLGGLLGSGLLGMRGTETGQPPREM